MSDVTISGRDYNKLKETEALVKAEVKAERELGKPGFFSAWQEQYKTKGAKGMVVDAGKAALQTVFAGALIYYVATSDWFDKIALFKDHWWMKALLVMGLGYWLYRKQSPWAAAVLSAGAAMFVQAWRARPVAKSDAKKDATTQGPDEDAGGWDWVDDTYGRRGRWQETPSGGRSYITDGHGAHAAERIAERVFEHARHA